MINLEVNGESAVPQAVFSNMQIKLEKEKSEKEHIMAMRFLFDGRNYEENLSTEVIFKNQRILMMGSVNYLGLSHHPLVKESMIKSVERYGVGGTGSRASNGCMDLHLKLDERIAKFIGKEKAIIFNSGYMANLGVISSIFSRHAVILCDKQAHLSIYDGIRLSGLSHFRYRHNDLNHLEILLKNIPLNQEKWLVMVGTYGVTGENIPLPEIVALAKKYQCKIYFDDAHLIGIEGPNKGGLAEKHGLLDQIDLIMGSFQMAFGNIGAFVAGDKTIMEKIQDYSRPYLFTYTLPAYSVSAILAGFDIIESFEGTKLIKQLFNNVEKLRKGIKSLGFKVISEDSQLISISINNENSAKLFAQSLLDNGLWGQLYVYPAVPKNNGSFRLSCMATHNEIQLDKTLLILEKEGKKLGII